MARHIHTHERTPKSKQHNQIPSGYFHKTKQRLVAHATKSDDVESHMRQYQATSSGKTRQHQVAKPGGIKRQNQATSSGNTRQHQAAKPGNIKRQYQATSSGKTRQHQVEKPGNIKWQNQATSSGKTRRHQAANAAKQATKKSGYLKLP